MISEIYCKMNKSSRKTVRGMVNICAGKGRKFSHKYKAVHERDEVADFFT